MRMLEERLREVGRRAAALEQEVERRGTLVRDAVEEAARLRRELARDRVEGPLAAGVPSASVAVPVPVPVPAAPLPVVTRAAHGLPDLRGALLAVHRPESHDDIAAARDRLRVALVQSPQPPQGATWYLPFTREAVPEVHISEGKVIAVPPEEVE